MTVASPGTRSVTFAVVVPLKSSSRGKSRLRLPAEQRAALAVAMAGDTLAAVAAADQVGPVLLVVEDDRDAARVGPPEIDTLVWTAPGLNRSIAAGAPALAASGWFGPVAVLPADLPFLQADELDDALLATDGQTRVVADGVGSGTTLLTASRPGLLRPRFGVDSFARHQRAGAVALLVDRASGLRRDVDLVSDLASAGAARPPGAQTLAALEVIAATSSAQVTVLP